MISENAVSRFARLWGALDPRRQVIVVLATMLSVITILGIARLAGKPDFVLLYAGLEPSVAGEVAAALEQSGVEFEARGDAVYVDSAARDRVRIALAADGLPANGSAGYELLDTLSGFGTTAQMFDAAYWRAKEGELARTIVSMRAVRAARVHIAGTGKQPFQSTRNTSASVTVTLSGEALTAEQARAIRFMVASAVVGLTPQTVSVIDSVGGIILAGGSQAATGQRMAGVADRETTMKERIERLLVARVGAGKAIVEVAIEADMDSETIVERIVDPASRVAISTDTEEKTETASGSDTPAVTVASNLPEGDTSVGGGSSSRNNVLTRERINYELSETRSERVRVPGQIRRISIAVLVDGVTTPGANGAEDWTPRSAEELASLEELVKSAAGFSAERGDQLSLQSLRFAATPELGTLANSNSFALPPGMLSRSIQTLVLGLVAVALAAFVVRPVLQAVPSAGGQDSILPGRIPQISDPALAALAPPADVLPGNRAELPVSEGNDSVARLREAVGDHAEDSARVLQSWLEEPQPQDQTT